MPHEHTLNYNRALIFLIERMVKNYLNNNVLYNIYRRETINTEIELITNI